MKLNREDHKPENKLKLILTKCSANDQCLEWTGSFFYKKTTKEKTYPYIYFKNKAWHGNRLVLLLITGQLGEYALHKCDNKKCLNPEHLYWGTPQQNVDDTYNRNRAYSQKMTHCKSGHEYRKENTLITKRSRGNYRRCKQCIKRYNKEAKYGKNS